jgi:hypothetical protein
MGGRDVKAQETSRVEFHEVGKKEFEVGMRKIQ